MASFKFALFVLSAVLLASQAEASVIQPVGNDISNIVIIIKKIVTNVEQLIDTLISDADELINDAGTNYQEFLNKVVGVVQKAFTDGLDAINEDLQDIAANNELFAPVLECVIGEEKDTVDAITSIVSSMGTCVEGPLNVLLSDLAPITEVLTPINEKIRKQVQELNQCSESDISGIGCAFNVLREIFDTIQDGIKEIVADAHPIKDDLSKLGKSIAACWTQDEKNTVAKFKKILANISACIKKH